MEWSEYIKNANRDETDERAIKFYNEWVKLIGDETVSRLNIIDKGFDPDEMNEFCFYPIDKWDRLINWAKTFYSDKEKSFGAKMVRATFLKYRIDPEGIKTPDDETDKKILNDLQEDIVSKEVDELPITSWWTGSIIKNAYTSELEVCQDNLPTMDDVSIKFNSIVSGVVVRNEKDIANNVPVRKTVHFQKNIHLCGWDMKNSVSHDGNKNGF